VSNAWISGLSSPVFPSAALMPPSAAPEWLRVGWSLETIATSAPASCASMAARMPAQPAPMTSTSCLASTSGGRYRIGLATASGNRWGGRAAARPTSRYAALAQIAYGVKVFAPP